MTCHSSSLPQLDRCHSKIDESSIQSRSLLFFSVRFIQSFEHVRLDVASLVGKAMTSDDDDEDDRRFILVLRLDRQERRVGQLTRDSFEELYIRRDLQWRDRCQCCTLLFRGICLRSEHGQSMNNERERTRKRYVSFSRLFVWSRRWLMSSKMNLRY